MLCLTRSRARRGFTLIELLVVTIIIGILAVMVVGAVVGALRKAKELAIFNEIMSMHKAIEDYKTNRGGAYPPNFDNQQLVTDHLYQAFPNRRSAAAQPPTGLDPAETLVFWLRRLSTDDLDPFRGSADRSNTDRQRLFEFDENRLADKDEDGWEEYHPQGLVKPYVYFHHAAYRNLRHEDLTPYKTYEHGSGGASAAADSETQQWVQPESFQIISAGLDDDYGNGGTYPMGRDYTEETEDNIVNFDRRKLGDAVP